VRAQVTLHRPVRDPLGTEAPQPGSAAILVVIDDKADRAAIESSARRLVRGTAPEIADASIVVETGATRAVLARVGPFTVEARSKPALVGVLAVAFGLIALLAASIAWGARPQRRGSSAQ
jgi:hypothetical protein